MIWYAVPVEISNFIFVMLLITTAMQIANTLASDRLLARQNRRVFIKIYGVLFTLITAFFTLEMLIVISSIEGGIYLATDPLYRLIPLVAPLLYIYKKAAKIHVVTDLNPLLPGYFVPLLRLPLFDRLPMPLPIFFSLIVAFWLFFVTARTMWSLILFSRSKITLNALSQIIHRISQGLCISDKKGWILEYNPAFIKLASRVGIHELEKIELIEDSICALRDAGKIRVEPFESGQLIQTDDYAYSLQISSFIVKGKTYMQIALSDVTHITRTARALEQENRKIEQKNQSLVLALDRIERETIVLQREQLCRTAHDSWSQRLTVAAFTMDLLLDKKQIPDDHVIRELCEQLSIPLEIESDPDESSLHSVLNRLSEMYHKLGVEIVVNGQITFSKVEEKALCSIIREAMANAIRHSYAKDITIDFYADDKVKGVAVKNHCLDHHSSVSEGRGIRDMITRATESGGLLRYEKNDMFTIRVIYPVSNV